MKLPLGIIADDYTGALMVACYLEGAGIYAPLVFKAEAVPANAKVVVVGARTRTIPTSDAVAEVAAFADALSAAGVNAFLYKPSAGFDSSPDGNIGQIADYLSDRTGLRPTLMAAGFPEYAITTHQGCLFYRGKLVSESIKRFDPLTPMSDPDLVRFLSRQTRGSIGLLNHLTLKDGLDALPAAAEALAVAGNDNLFFDVSDQDDLNVVAEFAASRDAVFIASDPVAAAYTKILCRDLDLHVPAPTHARGPAAVLSGTVGPVIARQLGRFSETYPIFQIDITDNRQVEALADDAIAWAGDHIGVQPFAISTSADPAAVERAQTQLGALVAARRAEAILSRVAIKLHERGVRRFVVAGGETSGSIVASLGVAAVRAFPEGPLGTGFCVTSGEDPISFFLKPGKHGADDILLRALEEMA